MRKVISCMVFTGLFVVLVLSAPASAHALSAYRAAGTYVASGGTTENSYEGCFGPYNLGNWCLQDADGGSSALTAQVSEEGNFIELASLNPENMLGIDENKPIYYAKVKVVCQSDNETPFTALVNQGSVPNANWNDASQDDPFVWGLANSITCPPTMGEVTITVPNASPFMSNLTAQDVKDNLGEVILFNINSDDTGTIPETYFDQVQIAFEQDTPLEQ